MKQSEAISTHRKSHPHEPAAVHSHAGAGQMALGNYSKEFAGHTALGQHPKSPLKGHKIHHHSKGGR